MRPDPVVEFCLGLGAIVAALAVALLLAFPPSFLDHRIAAGADLANVSHLAEGSSVSENGFVWGTVTGIEPVKGHFRVHLKVQPGFNLAASQGLALDETNPLQPATLVVARQCRLAAGEQVPAGCCPDRIMPASPNPDERSLASCGRLPNVIDEAKDTVAQTKAGVLMLTRQVGDLSTYVRGTVPPMLESTKTAVAATTTGMVAMKAVSDKALTMLNDQNIGNLTKVLASTQTTMEHVSTTMTNVDDLVKTNKEQLTASINNLSNVLATTAATMPSVVDNIQKGAENLRVMTGDLRQEPTSIVRRRERSDPSFVDPAPGK